MVSYGGLRFFLVFYPALAHRYTGALLFKLRGSGPVRASGGEKNMGCDAGQRPAGVLSGAGLNLCLCVYPGRVYAGAAAFGALGAFHEKT